MGKENGGLFSLLLLVKAITRIIHVKLGCGSIITNRGQQHMARNTSSFYPKCLFTYTWFLYFFCLFFHENKIGKKSPCPLCCNIYYFCYCLNKEMLEVHGMLYLLELDIWRFFTFRFITLSCSSELC